MPSQNVSLTEELIGYVEDLVAKGVYSSVSEVHQEAILNLKAEREHINELLEVGKRDMAEGRYTTFKTEEDLRAFFKNMEDDIVKRYAS